MEQGLRRNAAFQNDAHGIADLVHGRLVPGIQQHDGGGDELVVGQVLALVLRMDHVAQQVILRLRPPLGDHAAHIV
ncbi:hypothetical protein D3C78_1097720 [compost metagenome]